VITLKFSEAKLLRSRPKNGAGYGPRSVASSHSIWQSSLNLLFAKFNERVGANLEKGRACGELCFASVIDRYWSYVDFRQF
jgi:hypothetical protein